MDDEQYDIMADAEERHWWYLGLRDAIAKCLAHPSLTMPNQPRVLDAGCGTGGNLKHLGKFLGTDKLVGFDTSSRALEIAKRKVPCAELYQSDLRNPKLPEGKFDLIVCCDVLYVMRTNDAIMGLRALCGSLRNGGLFIWNLPAYNWLSSYHDKAVHTQERYTLRSLDSLCGQLGLKSVRRSYRLHALLPIIAAKRLAAERFTNNPRTSDLQQPSDWINRLLFRSLQFENRFIASGASFPWGSSVFAICRKL